MEQKKVVNLYENLDAKGKEGVMEKTYILQANIDNDGGNGAFTLVRYLGECLKPTLVFDFFTMGNFVHDNVYEDIVNNGGTCYSANLRKHKLLGHLILPFSFYKCIKKKKYQIVHIHSEVAYKHFLYAIAARCAGVKKIVIHSHSCDIDGNNKSIKYQMHLMFRTWVNMLGTDFLACSIPAAEWMFNSKVLNGGKFHVLHNGILPDDYKYSQNIREQLRSEYKISEKIVIGHVGALKKVKNQDRLLEILYDIHDERYMLMLIGDGEDRTHLQKKIKDLGLQRQVLLMGGRTDVAMLLQAMDVFVFPSYFEGIPMALIEAQAVGVPIIASDSINRDIQINDNVVFISLHNNNTEWIEAINGVRNQHNLEEGYINVKESLYNIKNSACILKEIYLENGY